MRSSTVLALNLNCVARSMSCKKCTEPRGELKGTEFLPLRLFSLHSCKSQLLVCCISTLLSPSYVQLASLSLRIFPRPAAIGPYRNLQKLEISFPSHYRINVKLTSKVSMASTCLTTLLNSVLSQPAEQRLG